MSYQSPILDDIFRALSDPTRRAILARLRERPRIVVELARGFPVSRPAISQHLGVLRDAGLVRERKVGRERYYRLKPARLALANRWLEDYSRFWTRNLEGLKRFVEADSEQERR
jgi:DNA-binding transcriptional ArsR family regulator